jgi:hypothetical protein
MANVQPPYFQVTTFGGAWATATLAQLDAAAWVSGGCRGNLKGASHCSVRRPSLRRRLHLVQ